MMKLNDRQSICSTNIVEFHTEDVIVSRYWWAFLIVIVGLTALIFSIWYLYMRRRRISDSMQFDDLEKLESRKTK